MDIANFGTSARGRPLIHKLLARASPNGEELTFSTRLLERRDQFLVFLREADGYPQMMRETVAAHRAHDYAYREQFVVDGAAVTDVGENKIRMALNVAHTEAMELALEVIHPLGVDFERFAYVLVVIHAAQHGRLPEQGHVERLAHVIEHAHNVGAGDCVADAQAGEPEDLRKRAHRHEHPRTIVILERVGIIRITDEFEVGFVGDDHNAFGHSRQEAVPILAPEDRPGRIVWIIEKDDACVLVDGVCYAVEVEEKAVLHRNGLRRAAGGCRRERIDREGMLRADRVEARAQKQEG